MTMGMTIDSDTLMRGLMALAQGNTHTFGVGRKEAALTLSTLPTFYSCCGLFEMCGSNDLLTLTIEREPFLDWIGFRANDECNQFVKLISYIGPSGTSTGTETTGASTACADAPGVEFGTCQVLLPDKGRIKRAGPVRDITENNRKVCEAYPTFRKDGTQITDELAWTLTLAGIALKQDFKRMLVVGNAANAGEFSGLEALVNTGYVNIHDGRRCSAMDSYVLDWGSNIMTYERNGFALVDYLIDIVRRIMTRTSWANLGSISDGDLILEMPSYLRDCLLDTFACWSVCPGVETVTWSNPDLRAFRNTLNGGTFGMGQIYVDGRAIPIITYDWHPLGQAAPYFTGDIYILTRRIGNMPVLMGQYIDMTQPANRMSEVAGYTHYKSTDGGKYLTYWKYDNECFEGTVVFRPNLYLSAPWAQARIQNVACRRPLSPISPDPTSSYFAEQYLNPALCPEDYLVGSQRS
jgi:hypothetical protein